MRTGLGVAVVIHLAEENSRLELVAVGEVDAFAGGSWCRIGEGKDAYAGGEGEEELFDHCERLMRSELIKVKILVMKKNLYVEEEFICQTVSHLDRICQMGEVPRPVVKRVDKI